MSLALVVSLAGVLERDLFESAGADEPRTDRALVAPDEASARLTALRRGARVEVESLRTETTSTWVEPPVKDGPSVMTTEAYGAPVRFRDGEDGRWREVDVTLVRSEELGAVVPRAHPRGLQLAAGGGTDGEVQDLVRLGRDGQLTLGWRGELPMPRLEGFTATYPDAVGPGIDIVVTATRTGYLQEFVLRELPADGVLPDFRLPVRLREESWKLGRGPGGGLRVEDGKGKLVAVGPAPVMFDADGARGADPTRGRDQQGKAATVTMDVATTEEGPELVLRPDPEFVKSATLPLTIDPSATLNDVDDTFVQSGTSGGNNYVGYDYLRSGYLWFISPAAVNRAYLKWNGLEEKAGVHVLSATASVWQWDAYPSASSCTGGGAVGMHKVTGSYDVTTVTYNTQPSFDASAVATMNSGHYNTNPNCPAGWVNFTGTGVRDLVQGWVNSPSSNHGVVLKAPAGQEGTATTWKAFRSWNYGGAEVPKLVFSYNSYPVQPKGRFVRPCSTACLSPSITNAKRPTLTADANDADGGNLRADFEVFAGHGADPTNGGATGPVKSGSVWVPAGTRASWVPSSDLADGAFSYRARVWDGALFSPWSTASPASPAWIRFTVDTAAPAAPAAAAVSPPSPAIYGSGTWSGNAGTAGTFQLTPGADNGGGTGVAGVLWAVDDPTPDAFLATTGAAVTVDFEPWRTGMHTLYVQTRDKAGNTSAVTTHAFGVGTGGLTSPMDGDRTAKRIRLAAEAAPGATAVTYQYRRADADTWTDVPGAVNIALSAQPDWDIAAALGDGPLQLRATFTGGSGGQSSVVRVTVDQQGDDAPTVEVGPGSVNTLTGNYTLSVTDATAFGAAISRSARSREPAAGAAVPGVVAPFGPSWVAGGLSGLANTAYTSVTASSGTASTVRVHLVDGSHLGFAKGAGTSWVPEVGSEDLRLTGSLSSGDFNLRDGLGTLTVFKRRSSTLYTLETTSSPGVGNTSVFTYGTDSGGTLRPTRISAPNPGITNLASSCGAPATPAAGCRVLELVYASTTSLDGSGLGDYAGRVSGVQLWRTIPGATPGTYTVAPPVTVSQYRYDSGGRLREVWDSRLSPAMKTTYTYDSDGRVASVQAPGLRPWSMTYGAIGTDPNAGRLLSVARDTLASAPNPATATWNVVYDVPLTIAAGGPLNMDPAGVAAWGQTGSQVPTDATAVFRPGTSAQTPSDHDGAQTNWDRAAVTYLNVGGRAVNESPFAGGLGRPVTTTEYDRYGNVVRALSAENRYVATHAGSSGTRVALGIEAKPSAERAALLSQISVFDVSGERELESFGPLQFAALPDAEDTIALVRAHAAYSYDQGRPTDGSAVVEHLVTTATAGARVEGTSTDTDVRTIKIAYDWTLGLPTRETTDESGLNLVRQYAYDTSGREIRRDMPSAVAAGRTTGADSHLSVYYTASGSAPCGARLEWAGMPCQTKPAGAISGGGTNPANLVTTTALYTSYGLPDAVIETANGSTRTTDINYDPQAPRPIKVTTTGGLGEATPILQFLYDDATGLPTETHHVNSGGSLIRKTTTGYDALGRVSSYTDADAGLTETDYDWQGRVSQRRQYSNGATPLTTLYDTYDAGDQLLRIHDPAVGHINTFYTLDGAPSWLWASTLGVTSTLLYDTTGAATSRVWDGFYGESDWRLIDEHITHNVHGETRLRTRGDYSGANSRQAFTYDQTSRLTGVEDIAAGTLNQCTTRDYTLDPNSNRTALTTRTGTATTCPTTGGTTTTHTHDTADRLLSTTGQPATTYDNFGRTLATPALTGTGALTLSYHANDRVRRIAAGTTVGAPARSYTLDPQLRERTITAETWNGSTWVPGTTTTQHFDDNTDAPAWTTTAGIVTRNVHNGWGELFATATPAGDVRLQITTLHGDIAAQWVLDTGYYGTYVDPDLVFDTDEFGNPRADTDASTPYRWLGTHQRHTDTLSGLTLMGVRLYNASTGRFLQVDPIAGAGANAYDYVGHAPCNGTDLSGLKQDPGDLLPRCDRPDSDDRLRPDFSRSFWTTPTQWTRIGSVDILQGMVDLMKKIFSKGPKHAHRFVQWTAKKLFMPKFGQFQARYMQRYTPFTNCSADGYLTTRWLRTQTKVQQRVKVHVGPKSKWANTGWMTAPF